MHEGRLNPAEYKFITKCKGAMPLIMEGIYSIKKFAIRQNN
jgi:hypothetical protein